MTPNPHSALLLLVGLAAACEAAPPAVTTLPTPAAAGSGEPYVAPAADGGVLLSWIEPAAEGAALRFARLQGDAWSEPATVASGANFFINWADFPSMLELSDGRLLAHWLVRGEGRAAYDVWYAVSADDGRTWSEPVRPHTDGTPTEHGFVSLFEAAAGLGLAWLDGRGYASAGRGAGEMSVRAALAGPDGAPGPEMLVDGRACDCCQTDVAITSTGPVLVYRDRSPEEVRDIVVTRLVGATWTAPVRVHADDWVIPACPVNGPAVAARGEQVAVAWFTAAQDTPRVRVALSGDAAETFEPPVRIDLGDPVGRVDVALLASGEAVVSWLERDADGTHVLVRTVGPEGRLGEPLRVGASSEARPSGFPRMAAAGDRLILAWTWPGPPSEIRIAALRFPTR